MSMTRDTYQSVTTEMRDSVMSTVHLL